MVEPRIGSILIAGGGSAGWMSAALLARMFGQRYQITLVESADIGTIGVGEAAIPPIRKFNALLGIDEADFLRATQGTFKLGIQFVDWARRGESYVHGFGPIGQKLGWLAAHQYWLKARAGGSPTPLGAYSINVMAALANKFMPADPKLPQSPLGQITHAYHFDATLYARLLRDYAEARSVTRREGTIDDVELAGETGAISAVRLANGERLAADFFIDCTGFAGLLIEKALGCGYESWAQWLPCDRALALPCARVGELTPYTRSTAHDAGWQWRIPLQHRTGNGHVYASAFIDDDQAEAVLRAHLDTPSEADALRICFETGRRRQFWAKNCVAIGLASGFLEPLESTSLHLIQSAIVRLVGLFPDSPFDTANRAEYNRQTIYEYERTRDFLILHYKATTRDDTPFWRHCRDMAVPDTLARKMELFAANGRIFREDEELFAEESWIQVLIGQGIIPRAPDPAVNATSDAEIARFLGDVAGVIGKCVDVMPAHADALARICATPVLA